MTSTGRISIKRALAALIVCASLFAPATHASQAAHASQAVPTSMRVGMVLTGEEVFHPLTAMNRDLLSLMNLVYEGLVTLDDNQEPVPALAESWEALSDGKTWLFHIRDNVYFHDGRRLTAYDVAATMDLIRILATNGSPNNEKGIYWLTTGNDSISGVLDEWSVDDDYTLRVRTKRPYYGVLYAMTFPVLQAQSANTENPPGTGPYRVDYFLPGQELALVGNQNWWRQTPHVSSINAIAYPDAETLLRAFEAEDIDIMMTRSTTAVRYRGVVSNRINSYDFSTRQLECLLINNGVGRLSDARIRQAIAHAINKSRLITSVYQGVVTQTNTLQRPGSWLYNDSTAVYAYNPERANQLLDELGWNLIDEDGFRYKMTEDGKTQLSFRLNYYNEADNALRKEAAQEIQSMLRAVGIRAIISTYSFENGSAKLKSGDYDLFLCAYNFDITPDPTFALLSNGYGNYARYRSDDMNKKLNELRKAPSNKDEEEKEIKDFNMLAAMRQKFQDDWFSIQEQMAQDCPFIPLYWRNGVVLTRYPYSSVRDIREFELLDSIESYR